MKLNVCLKNQENIEYQFENGVFATRITTNNLSTIEGDWQSVKKEVPVFMLEVSSLINLSFAEKQIFYKFYTDMFNYIKENQIDKIIIFSTTTENEEMVFDSDFLNVIPIGISIIDELGQQSIYNNTYLSVNVLLQ